MAYRPHNSVLLVPAVAAALVVAVLAIGSQSADAVTNCSPSASWGKNRPDLAAQVVTLVNRHRASKGLSQLAILPSLTASSGWKSLHLAGNHYFAHDDPAPPVARSAYQRARDCGFNGNAWGENIAWGYPTAQAVVTGWLNSPGHRANIEGASYTQTGVGVASGADGSLYWTQSFGRGGSGATTAPSATTPTNASGALGGTPARVSAPTSSRFIASVRFVRVKTGQALTAAQVRCRAEVDGRLLQVVANVFRGTAAECAWTIPPWARGKQLTGTVAVTAGSVAARRQFMRLLH
jgi:uncharacterized protein YkwD